MKRIVLGISVLLMLVQNGFSKSDTEWDEMITNESDITWKQIYRCYKGTMNHPETANVNICMKATKLIEQNMYVIKEGAILNEPILNTGVIYRRQGDTLNAYKYYMKAARLGNKTAQRYLDKLCKESPWACK